MSLLKRWSFFQRGTLLVFTLMLSACQTAQEPDHLKIGTLLPITGIYQATVPQCRIALVYSLTRSMPAVVF